MQSLLQFCVKRFVGLSQRANDAFQGCVLRDPTGGKGSVFGITIANATITQYTLTLNL